MRSTNLPEPEHVDSNRKSRRPRLRYTLRTLFALVTVFSLWLGWHVKRTVQQQRAVSAVQNNGGWVAYDFQWNAGQGMVDPNAESWVPRWALDPLGVDFFHTAVAVNFAWSFDRSGRRTENSKLDVDVAALVNSLPDVRCLSMLGDQANDKTFRALTGVRKLTHLNAFYMGGPHGRLLSRPTLTDEGVAHLADRLPNLRCVHIYNAYLTDRSLKYLSRCDKLEEVYLQGNRFTDEGLRHLADSNRLRKLWLGQARDVNVSDAGLAALDGLRKLELFAVGGHITDDGLRRLASCSQLKEIILSTNHVSQAGRQQLLKAMPGVKLTISDHVGNNTVDFVRSLQIILATSLGRAADWQMIEPNTEFIALFPDRESQQSALNDVQADFGQWWLTIDEFDAFVAEVLNQQGITISEMAEALVRRRWPMDMIEKSR